MICLEGESGASSFPYMKLRLLRVAWGELETPLSRWQDWQAQQAYFRRARQKELAPR
jgi:hypothetical protein